MSCKLIAVSLLLVLALPLRATVFDSTFVAPATAPQQVTVDNFIQTKIRDMGDLLGRDFNWKEKLALRLVRKKLRRVVKKNPSLASHSFSPAIALQEPGIYLPQPLAEEAQYSVPSIISFALALLFVPLWSLNVVMGILTLILALASGIIGLGQIRRQPEQYKGKGFAWFGVIVSGLAIIGLLLVILVLFFFWT